MGCATIAFSDIRRSAAASLCSFDGGLRTAARVWNTLVESPPFHVASRVVHEGMLIEHSGTP